MTEMIGEALVQGIRVYGDTRKEEARYAYLAGSRTPVHNPAPKSEELTVPNLELSNYVKRTEVGDEQHVLVVDHKEHLEKKFSPPPPPTAEELEAAREQKRFMAKIYAGVASVAMVVVGAVIIVERRASKVVPSIEG